jgi:phosphotransferase system, enzyme I, PtsP
MRILMNRLSILRHQARALLQASSGKEMRLMFPMVSDITEFEEAKRIVGREMALARHCGFEPLSALFLGAMIEVPTMLWQLD